MSDDECDVKIVGKEKRTIFMLKVGKKDTVMDIKAKMSVGRNFRSALYRSSIFAK